MESPSLSGLAARLTALEERAAVLATLRAYSEAIDRGQRRAWVECFTADGVFEVRSHLPGYPAQRHAGEAQLRAFAAAHGAPPQAFHKHLYVPGEIEVSGSEARASASFVHLLDVERRPAVLSYGRYLDRLRKGGDGRWRIAERIVEVDASDEAARATRADR